MALRIVNGFKVYKVFTTKYSQSLCVSNKPNRKAKKPPPEAERGKFQAWETPSVPSNTHHTSSSHAKHANPQYAFPKNLTMRYPPSTALQLDEIEEFGKTGANVPPKSHHCSPKLSPFAPGNT
jgi:hypothetical protein